MLMKFVLFVIVDSSDDSLCKMCVRVVKYNMAFILCL